MSCQADSGRVAQFAGRLSAGLSQMSSKQAFFTGMAVGASGTGLGALIVANRQRIATLFRRAKPPRQAVPVTGKAQPANGPARSKPKPIPALASGSPAKAKPKPIPALAAGKAARSKPKPIPVLAAPPTKLQPTAVQVQTGGDQPFVAQNSYRVVRPDGSDTGLAITPFLEPGNGEGNVAVKEGAWGVTHTGSGALVDGPFNNVEQAQGLATKLSALSWTGSVSSADAGRAKQIIKAYRQSLAGEKR